MSSSKTLNDRMVWVDIETSGLNTDYHEILEVGLALTTPTGILRDMAHWVIKPHNFEQMLKNMPGVVKEMHTKNLLLDEIQLSHAIHIEDAEIEMIDWMDRHAIEPRGYPMAGSSVHFDREFLKVFAPPVEARFHYRDADISSVREFARLRAASLTDNEPTATERHRALPDIRDSLKLYRFYQTHFLNVDWSHREVETTSPTSQSDSG